MPSKKSKPSKSRQSQWKVAREFSEAQLSKLAQELADELSPGDRVLLEGPMGAGKSTFARALIRALGVDQGAEGSPTFAIAHEYRSKKKGRDCAIVHLDL